jgi:hypothetical protein
MAAPPEGNGTAVVEIAEEVAKTNGVVHNGDGAPLKKARHAASRVAAAH